jgi:hypothetical protein
MSQGGRAPQKRWLQRTLGAAQLVFWFATFLIYSAAVRDETHILFGMLCLLVGGFICTFVHESGHAIAALACNWRVVVFVVRPFGWHVANRNLAIVPRSYNRRLWGWVLTVPREPDPDARANKARIIAAGPIASLALATIALLACAAWWTSPDTGGVALAAVAMGLGIQSLQMGIFSILPSATDDVVTDGVKWRALRRADTDTSFTGPLPWVMAMLSYKIRLRDLPAWMLAEATALPVPSPEPLQFLATLEIARTLDAVVVDVPLARALIDRHRATYGPDEWLTAIDAWVAAMWEGDLDRARLTLAEHAGKSGTSPMFLATEAAVAARGGEGVLVRQKLKAMRKAVAAQSPFRDRTFRDIGMMIEGALAERQKAGDAAARFTMSRARPA